MVPRSAARYESRIGEAPIGIWAGVGSVALPAGPLLGGLLVHGLGWRWVFAINVPIVAVGGLLAARVVASDSETGPGRIDRAGTALAAGALATATYAVIEAGRAGVGPAVIASALVAIAAAIAFCRVELRVDRPMLPLQLFRRPAFSTANAVAGAMNFGTLGLLFLLTLFLQDVQGRDALHAGLALLPLFLPLSILAPVTGRVVGRFGPKPVMIAGLLLAAAGIGLVATWQVHTEYAALLPALLGWGIGLGLLTPAVVAAAIAAVPADRSGLASGVNNTARQAGGAMGIAGYGAVAGQPSSVGHFLTGLHFTGVVTAGLYTFAAMASLIFVGAGRRR